jgi:hypothetical protein
VFYDGFGNDWVFEKSGEVPIIKGSIDPKGGREENLLISYPSTISVTAYMRHNMAFLKKKTETEIVSSDVNSGGGGSEETEENGANGEDEVTGETGAMNPSAEFEYTYEYKVGQEDQWRPVADDSPDAEKFIRNRVIALKYILFIPEEQNDGGFDITSIGSDLVHGQEIEAGFWPQAKLYVYAVVAGKDPNGEVIPSRILDCGEPVTLNLHPGLNHFDIYLHDTEFEPCQ